MLKYYFRRFVNHLKANFEIDNGGDSSYVYDLLPTVPAPVSSKLSNWKADKPTQ
jgi:hypothetical protein